MEQKHRYDGDSEEPMYSRLFVSFNKMTVVKRNLEEAFSEFGQIEDIKMPYDAVGRSRGVAFIKFSKTSEAAAALEALDGKPLGVNGYRMKVQVAVNRSEIEKHNEDPEKYKRLFLHVPRIMNEKEVENVFNKFGRLLSVFLQRDHNTGESKGFAYVTFSKFSEAAKAFEECDRMYRPIFAKPKGERRQMTAFESNIGMLANSCAPNNSVSLMSSMREECSLIGNFTSVKFMCWPYLTRDHVETLFGLIPGMEECRYFVDHKRNCGKGVVRYGNAISASYAVTKLHEFEYPPGMPISVRPDESPASMAPRNVGMSDAVARLKTAICQGSSGNPDLAELAEAIAQASKLIKMATGDLSNAATPDSKDLNYCSVSLPPAQPLAHIDSPVAKRCFIVCKPTPPPLSVLRDVFCRFGNLINVYTLPNKTVGYARYATVESADEAIKNLHGAEVCGVRMIVVEAEAEAPPKKRKFKNDD